MDNRGIDGTPEHASARSSGAAADGCDAPPAAAGVRVGRGTSSVDIGPGRPLAIIAGPCVLESEEINIRIAETLAESCAALGLGLILKGSFDKANRSSASSARGPGIEAGLASLAALRDRFGSPVTTDIHEVEHAECAAAAVDLLQIPAFLCRQTDLLVAAGATGLPVNVKKGQFMSPAEMGNAIGKVRSGGAAGVILTERGTFFGYHRLVNDFIGLGDLMDLGWPVCFDATHSTQLPGGERTSSGGRPERAPLLAKAAVAAGVHAVFLECHPEPARALSDASTVMALSAVPALLRSLQAIRTATERVDAVVAGEAPTRPATTTVSGRP